MSVRNLKDGHKKPWLCECYPQGSKGKRIRKRFATKGEATAFERYTMSEIDDKPWLAGKTDNRRLSDLLDLWWKLHGKNLKSDVHAFRRRQIMCEQLNDPIAVNTIAQTDSQLGEVKAAVVQSSPIFAQITPIIKICLATGARIMEAIQLKDSQVTTHHV